jgi:2-polyprenyl-3-methyl-5-hydroxy-6-metoxy-1,4-benzoquinol methylase
MNADPINETSITDSWRKNAAPWIVAVRQGKIESRQVTDQAIVDAILSRSPNSVLDLGCGEGWLGRALANKDVHVIGVDIIPGLVEQAQGAGGGDFRVASFQEIAAGKFHASVDAVVCNFALLGKGSVEGIFRSIPSLLNPHGSFVVQTLHPIVACGEHPYQDGWREGSWDGFGPDFTDPAPWYFRTLESWIRMFVENGLRLLEMRESLHSKTQKPASVIFVAEVAD